MLNIVWVCIILLSSLYAMLTGNAYVLGDAFFNGAKGCVNFVLEIGASMVFWQGVLAIADKSSLSDKVSKILSPIISFIFKGVKRGSNEARLISSNVSANILGLANAATPLGIEAMRELSLKAKGGTATDDMCLLAVINSASLQLVPSTLIAMRSSAGSSAPAEIIVPIWIVSTMTIIFAVSIAKIFGRGVTNG